MSVTLMMVSHFAQKVRCEPSPPHIRAKRQKFAFNIGSPVGCVPAGFLVYRTGSDCDDAPIHGAK